MAITHSKQPYASTSPTSQEIGRICRYAGQAVRALPIRVITVGRKRSEGRLLVGEYKPSLNPIAPLKIHWDGSAQVKDEEVAMMKLLGSEDWVVVLDERGRDINSEQMAELLRDAGNSGAPRISFCIGGAYGHGRQARKRANVTIKLSSMVLNHQIARVTDGTALQAMDYSQGTKSSLINLYLCSFPFSCTEKLQS